MKKYIHFSFLFFVVLTSVYGCDKIKEFNDPAKILPPVLTNGKSYFVSDVIGSDANSGLTLTAPFKTIATAYNLISAGDTIYLMNGTFSSPSATILNITKSGSASKYITVKAYPGHSPKIYISGDVWNGVVINGSYIIMEGIDFQGDNPNLTYAGALAAYNISLAAAGAATTAVNAKYNTNGISIGGPAAESKSPHHVVIRNCKVHDFPGGGMSAIQADYITWEGNTVYNNAWYMMYGGSGMSILCPVNSDGPDVNKYKNIVRNNVCYSNKTTIPWIGITPARLSDGNGIIIDINVYPYNQPTVLDKPYNGRTLVENNVIYNNGGSGVHSYLADHVDIINNTAYGNGYMVDYPDIFGNRSRDTKIMNNIMYARTGGKCNAAPTSGYTTVYSNNIYFNGTVGFSRANDKVANPLFVAASVDPLVANFNITIGSPAIDAGTQSIFSAKDIKGVARPKGAGVDCGAYEF